MRKSLKESKEEDNSFHLFLSFSGAHLDQILLKCSFQKETQKTSFQKRNHQIQAPPCCHWIHAGEGYSVEQALNGTECGSNIVIACGGGGLMTMIKGTKRQSRMMMLMMMMLMMMLMMMIT